MKMYQDILDRYDRAERALKTARRIWAATHIIALSTACLWLLTGCCTSTLQPGCDPMPKWRGYSLQIGETK